MFGNGVSLNITVIHDAADEKQGKYVLTNGKRESDESETLLDS